MAIEVPHGYNPLTMHADVEYMFHWAKINEDDDPVEWVEHGWDYTQNNTWRKLRKQYKFPVYNPLKVIDSLSQLDTSFSSIEENITSNDNNYTPLPSPLCNAKKNNIILNTTESKPINPDNSFFDHVFKK